jgi:hypothetical protein
MQDFLCVAEFVVANKKDEHTDPINKHPPKTLQKWAIFLSSPLTKPNAQFFVKSPMPQNSILQQFNPSIHQSINP